MVAKKARVGRAEQFSTRQLQERARPASSSAFRCFRQHVCTMGERDQVIQLQRSCDPNLYPHSTCTLYITRECEERKETAQTSQPGQTKPHKIIGNNGLRDTCTNIQYTLQHAWLHDSQVVSATATFLMHTGQVT